VTDQPRFAHASEAELARILDYYDVRWEYEPRTFPILWSLDGAVVESFSPDFYLPELDLFVELTTLKQSLVRRKNRKLRRLRELYPDIRVKLFYGKDFKALMLKYGRFDIAASLSGLEGQALANNVAVPLAELAGAATLASAPAAAPRTAPVASAVGNGPTRHRPSRGTRRRRARRAYASATPMSAPGPARLLPELGLST
jgi:hypoxanthine phosphoribosyltransferase